MITRDKLVEILKQTPQEVKFTKANGEVRVMFCTLAPEYLPEVEATSKAMKQNTDTITVWDLEKQAWRAFRMDRLIDVKGQ